MAKVTVKMQSTCGTQYCHQPFLLQLSVGNTWIPPEPIRFPNDDAPNEKDWDRYDREDKKEAEEKRKKEEKDKNKTKSDEQKAKEKADQDKKDKEKKDRREKEQKERNEKDGSPKVDVGKVAEAARKALAGAAGQPGSGVSDVDGGVSAGGSKAGSTTIFSFSFEATGEVDVGCCGESGSSQVKVTLEVETEEDEVFRVKILKDADVRNAHNRHGWEGTPDDHDHSTRVFGGKGNPRGTGDKPIEVTNRVGSAASGLGAYVELAPWSGSGASPAVLTGPAHRQFAEAVPLAGAWGPSARYFADGFYYRRDLAAGATGEDIALASVGFSPGRALTGRGDGPRSALAARRIRVRELQPVERPLRIEAPVLAPTSPVVQTVLAVEPPVRPSPAAVSKGNVVLSVGPGAAPASAEFTGMGGVPLASGEIAQAGGGNRGGASGGAGVSVGPEGGAKLGGGLSGRS